MKTPSILATALLFSCLTASSFAGERGIINQANPLDDTMRFYLHPAHLYLSTQAPHSFGEHPAVLVKRGGTQVNGTPLPTPRTHPALLGRAGQPAKVAQSQAGRIFP